jgi:hypothetical protein
MPTMALAFDQSKDEIARLVDYFAINRNEYLGPKYKEAQARMEFIDPLFAALGWDVANTQHLAPSYREVVVEDSLEIEGQKKAPDYVFRVGRERRFFAEAKKPGVDLKISAASAYQLRRYAWTAKLPLSLLTDFDELAVYDCRVRPYEKDKASVARVNYLTFDEYPDRWREVWDVFSREAVWGGSFDQYAESGKGKRGTSTVDAAFLNEIEGWREALAHNLALRNPRLTVDELCDSVQRTIDRIIFLRMAEDRGIEEYGRLQRLIDTEGVYPRLIDLFRLADKRYNAGLFNFSKGGDRLTPALTLDDKIVKHVLADLYFPQSPYEFSVLPVEILGNVYEQFLGRVIRLTPGHRAKVEEKPEVRKAGGVYYTPAYIVNYIVKHTVGALVEGKSPAQIRGFRVLDPACGSGSFLLGAYQFLLDYCLQWYIANNPEKHKKEVYRLRGSGAVGAEWYLTTAERKRILTGHIFGVDIDRQAVEVTKLSLLLKVLETESGATFAQQLTLLPKEAQERALPNLDQNIKCGNSLIDPGAIPNHVMLDADELRRANPFDWACEFPEILRAGGFDCIIGNPPYIRIQKMNEWAPLEVEVYKSHYAAASSGNYDIYVVFVEKGLDLLNKRGRLGFILPHKFFNAHYGEALRTLISKGNHLAEVVHFGDEQVFTGATTYTCLLFLNKAGVNEVQINKVGDLSAWRSAGRATTGIIPSRKVTSAEWNFAVGPGAALFEQLAQMPVKLEDATDRIFQGIKTSADKVYVVEELERKERRVKIYSSEKGAEYWLEQDLLHPLIKGGDSKRYSMSRTLRLILFPYTQVNDDSMGLIPETDLKAHYPLTYKYLLDNKPYLEGREHNRMKGEKWYGYIYPKALYVMRMPKIFTPDIASRAAFSLDETGEVFFTGGVSGGYGILVKPEWSREYVLGLLNSKLLEWVIRQTATPMRGGYFSYESRFIRSLPIYRPNLSNLADLELEEKLVTLVKKMLQMQRQVFVAKDSAMQERHQRLIDSTDAQIDSVVYELYGLTAQEIAVVETAIR